jgi:CHAT domain-containing protein
VTVREGVQATEGWFREEGPKYGILHVATFGFVNRANPLFSHLDLNPSGSFDGRLEVHELFQLNLQADLVVLSACETAVASGSRADVPPGDDWVGFVRGFLATGARNVLGSLWRVEDQATTELMSGFYRNLAEGAEAPLSLARAQRALLSRPETANPFFWAAFCLVGEGRGAW